HWFRFGDPPPWEQDANWWKRPASQMSWERTAVWRRRLLWIGVVVAGFLIFRWAQRVEKHRRQHEAAEEIANLRPARPGLIVNTTDGSDDRMGNVTAAPAAAENPAKNAIPDYRPVAAWPQLPADVKLGPVSAVATDSTDRVFVLQRA